MKKASIAPLVVVLLLGVGLASLAWAAAPATPAPEITAVQASPCDAPVSALLAGATDAPALADLFVPKPINMDPPICQVACVTTTCQHHSDCTAAPGGKCNFACPQTGCCVYP